MSFMSGTRTSGRFVVPGEKLGVIEEFIPDAGTYVADGVILSKSVGYILMDHANKKVSVYPAARNPNVPNVGAIVVGSAMSVQSSLVVVRLTKVRRRFISGFFSGVIHISDVSFEYTENMFDAFKVGDLVRAKVVSEANRTYHLSTKGDDLGVIYAYCSQCGGFLSLKDKELECGSCGRVEGRKIALDYGTGNL